VWPIAVADWKVGGGLSDLGAAEAISYGTTIKVSQEGRVGSTHECTGPDQEVAAPGRQRLQDPRSSGPSNWTISMAPQFKDDWTHVILSAQIHLFLRCTLSAPCCQLLLYLSTSAGSSAASRGQHT
jgi:hypothetical protein